MIMRAQFINCALIMSFPFTPYPIMSRGFIFSLTSSSLLLALAGCAQAAPPLSQTAPFTQRLSLNPLDAPGSVGKGGWRLESLAVALAGTDIPAKVGSSALVLRGDAQIAGAKGDFSLAEGVPGAAKTVGMWVFISADSNVQKVGLQWQDGEGESLTSLVNADWTGWKWVEIDFAKSAIAPAYEQKDKNGKMDFPVKGIHAVWFATKPGASFLGVDGLAATTELSQASAPLEVQMSGAAWGETGSKPTQSLLLTNFSDQKTPVKIEFSIQRDAALFSLPAPDAVLGSDAALKAPTWTEIAGVKTPDASATDGRDWTGNSTEYNKGAFTEAFQTVDLGKTRSIQEIRLRSSDANWSHKVDVLASADGKEFAPVAELQNVDLHKKWGEQKLSVKTPFSARWLKFRHHSGGAGVDKIALPSNLAVFDGASDESADLPLVGEMVESGTLGGEIAPRDFAALSFGGQKPLSSGSYLIAAKIVAGTRTQLVWDHFHVLPAPLAGISPRSRFGINSSGPTHSPSLERLGIGWARFENMKWQMISPEPNVYKFDGSVAPWVVKHDEIVADYRAQGISVLPFLFQTAPYATSAPAEIPKNRWESYPPKDNALMADFVFQTAARYGAKKHPENALKTSDKKSGLNQINHFEIWNEPNLTAPSWGPWVGTTAQYLEMYRSAAEAVKKADPSAKVTNGGYAGIEVETVDPLRSYRYADGKKPLDFVDILNVHYYSGRVAPELATTDTNVNRSGKEEAGRTYEETLQRLVNWRDQNKPGIPIWLTETGYDTSGSHGTDEATQAARLPRVIMLALANGIEKVFVYRETGSTPSQHAASGLFRNDGTMKPAWMTYATLIRELDGIENGKKLPHPNPNVRVYAWKRGAETVVSAWAVDGTATLDLNLGQSTATDAFGASSQKTVAANFPLSAYPTYFKKISNLAPISALLTQADRAETARRDKLAKQAKLRAYLFDFGGREFVGSLDVGATRAFTPVMSPDVYDEAKGFGFLPGAAMRDDDKKWISDAMERDSTRVNKDVEFRIKAAPGRYELKVSAAPIGGRSQLTISGAQSGEKTLDFGKDGAPLSATIEVGVAPLSLRFGDYTDIKWISLVEID